MTATLALVWWQWAGVTVAVALVVAAVVLLVGNDRELAHYRTLEEQS